MSKPDFAIAREIIVEAETMDEELLDKCTLLGLVDPQAFQSQCELRGFNTANVPREVRKDIIDRFLIRVAASYLRAVDWNPTAEYVFQCRELDDAFAGLQEPPDLSDANASIWYLKDWA